MLRTPMWRITEESETNGMTLSDRNGRIMLNVKFPNYQYLEEVVLDEVSVVDKDDVSATIITGYETVNGEAREVRYKADLDGMDLTRLVEGMKVSALIKDYKDEDKAKFLTLTPENTIVAGFMSEYKEKDGKYTFEVDGAEYRLNGALTKEYNLVDDVSGKNHDGKKVANNYVVFEAEGKKVKNMRKLPTAVEYAETQSDIDAIDEDALVIIDGEWADASAMTTDCVYSTIEDFGSDFYVASTKTDTTTFDVMYAEEEDWDGDKSNVEYVSLNDEDMRIVLGDGEFVARYQSKNNKDAELDKLEAKISDNDYSDCEVSVYYNYLGIPVRLHFGEVDKNAKNAGFYAVTSNGAWGEGSREGKRLNISLVGQDGAEDDYVTTTTAKVIENGTNVTDQDTYKEKATFVWALLDDNGDIKTLVELKNGMTSGNVLDKDNNNVYTSKYDIKALETDTLIDGKKLGETEYTLNKSAYIYEAIAITDEDNNVTGFDVEVSNSRDDYDGYTLPKGTLVAFENGTTKVKYVFIGAASDSKLEWGKVDSINYNKETVEVAGATATKLNENSVPNAAKGDLVGYTTNKAGDTIKIVVVKKAEALSDNDMDLIKDGNIDEDDVEEGIINNAKGKDMDEDEVGTEYKKYKVVVVNLKKDSDGKVSISSVTVSEEKGFDELESVINDWDRVLVDEDHKVIFVFHGVFDKHTELEDGVVSKVNKTTSAGETVSSGN